MPGPDDILMGYRESGPERDIVMMKYAGRCILCNNKTYVVPSGFERLRDSDSDPQMVCNVCWNDPTFDWERYMGSG